MKLPLFLLIASSLAAFAAIKPNFVIIVADDLGWADVGYQEASLRVFSSQL